MIDPVRRARIAEEIGRAAWGALLSRTATATYEVCDVNGRYAVMLGSGRVVGPAFKTQAAARAFAEEFAVLDAALGEASARRITSRKYSRWDGRPEAPRR